MIKGINGYGYFDELVVPIIENTAWEHELADMLGATIAKYPRACAVLVRRHGMYVWGNTWEQAKRHGECLHYLFDVAIKMKMMGMDFSKPPLTAASASTTALTGAVSAVKRSNDEMSVCSSESKRTRNKKYQHVVFDIEGTTTPISFGKDVLFPYSVDWVRQYLESTWELPQTQEDVALLVQQGHVDGLCLLSLTVDVSRSACIDFLTSYVTVCVAADRKDAALKQLQGHIWRAGYESGELKSIVFEDTVHCFNRLTALGTQISIYSSGSREAQRLLFKHTELGDLRACISCYFDTAVGGKREVRSYLEILKYLGVDTADAADVLFVTDIYEEAEAAAAAGLDVTLSVRPGNAPLPGDCTFRIVDSFDSI